MQIILHYKICAKNFLTIQQNKKESIKVRIKEVKLYKFSELPTDIQDKVIEDLCLINVEYFDWWKTTYEDADQVGLKITGFDIDIRKTIKGEFIQSATYTANAIIANHGENCDTFKTAQKYLTELTTLKNIDSVHLMPGEESDTTDIDNEFLKAILNDYWDLIKGDYEYRTSRESIIETIEANEYEFTIDGKMES